MTLVDADPRTRGQWTRRELWLTYYKHGIGDDERSAHEAQAIVLLSLVSDR
jgi:hypothetical protein